MARSCYLAFGLAAYAVFLATFLWLVAFIADLPALAWTVDRPSAALGAIPAAAVDLALIGLFGLQHSVMARQGFKAAWTRMVPGPVERSAYVLCASAVLILLFLLWQPLPLPVWTVTGTAGVTLLWLLFAAGWAMVLVSTFLISHFELFGLRQVWLHHRGRTAAAPVFRQPLFYRIVRHPLYAGFFLAFWATPRMTAGHLLLAAGLSAYMLIAIRYEERDLVGLFGADYEAYRTRTGMLVPRIGRRA